MQIHRLVKIAAACAAVSTVSPGTATAQVIINPGTFNAVPTAATPTGTIIDQRTGNFFASNAGATVSGTFVAQVYRNGDPGTGVLDFWYQFTTGPGSTAGITQFSASSFAAVTTAAGFNAGDIDGPNTMISGADQPVNASRTANGVTVAFDFVEVGVGETSYALLVRTNSTAYALGNSTVQGAASANFTTFAPINPNAEAPEPGTMALVGTGILGMAGIVARRRLKR